MHEKTLIAACAAAAGMLLLAGCTAAPAAKDPEPELDLELDLEPDPGYSPVPSEPEQHLNTEVPRDEITEGPQSNVDIEERVVTVDIECGQLATLSVLEDLVNKERASPEATPASISQQEETLFRSWIRTSATGTKVSVPMKAAIKAAENGDYATLQEQSMTARQACIHWGSIAPIKEEPPKGG